MNLNGRNNPTPNHYRIDAIALLLLLPPIPALTFHPFPPTSSPASLLLFLLSFMETLLLSSPFPPTPLSPPDSLPLIIPFDPSKNTTSFSNSDFSSRSPRRKTHPHRVVRCSLEQGLRQRPVMLKPTELRENLEFDAGSQKPQEGKPTSGVGGQIEKLVLFKMYDEALELFEIVESNEDVVLEASTYGSLVNACLGLKSFRGVKRIVNHMFRSRFKLNLYMTNRVLLMLVKCGMMIDARRLFDAMPHRNFVSWNIIIGGLVESGDYKEAFRLFLLMWEQSSDAGSRTFATVIRACAGMGLIYAGRQLHSCAMKLGLAKDKFVSCGLIDMYSKCGSIENAQFVFDGMLEKTVVAWNSIIAGYALHGFSEDALDLYYKMRVSGVKMDHFTYSTIISICSRLASLEHAKQAHACLVRHGFGSDIVANSALVNFYSKWGRVEDARTIFDRMPRKNVISWNSLIAGYAHQGQGDEAVHMFKKMLQEGMVPNHVTFLAVLSACSYSGLWDQGWEFFASMSSDHRIKPRAMHYACMVALVGREGRLDEAFAMIKKAPFEPTRNMWAALLTACRIHKNLELGRFAAERLLELEPEKLSNYIVLLNLYKASGRLEEGLKVLQALERKGLRLRPACSWIEINKRAHGFCFGDQSHERSKEIYRKLDELMEEVAKQGYVPQSRSLLPDVDEEEERRSMYHSEKLAIAFGLISTSRSTPLQIVQGHRICSDCHNLIKLIALVSKRDIVVRDASRFHHFRDGSCSCRDYW
ncbi:hypothetical protein ACLOJK_029886 [Asimina triloba]